MTSYFMGTMAILVMVTICSIGSGMCTTPWWFRVTLMSALIGSVVGFFGGIPAGPLVGTLVGFVAGQLCESDISIAYGVIPGATMGVLWGNLHDRGHQYPGEAGLLLSFMVLIVGLEFGAYTIMRLRTLKTGE